MGQVRLTWLADVLRAAGCDVVEEPGWETRSRPDGDFNPRAVMLHHDASPPGETSSGVDVIRDGRDDLPGPLAQLWLSYSGTWHVVAAGRASHAGEGEGWGAVRPGMGNVDAIGIETDHTTNEQWTDGQRRGAAIGLRAIFDHMGLDYADALTAHKEYAPGRKVDPDPLDMRALREWMAEFSTESEGYVKLTRKSYTYSEGARFSAGVWHTLKCASDSWVVIGGPARYSLTAQAYFRLDVAGGGLSFRAFRSTESTSEGRTSTGPTLRAVADETGWVKLSYAYQGECPEGEYVRLEVCLDVDGHPDVIHSQAATY